MDRSDAEALSAVVISEKGGEDSDIVGTLGLLREAVQAEAVPRAAAVDGEADGFPVAGGVFLRDLRDCLAIALICYSTEL